MKDIENRQDIEKLVKNFYEKAFADSKLGHIFVDIAKLNLEEHLPIITDFWEMILFQTVNFQEKYRRSPMQKHIELASKLLCKKTILHNGSNYFLKRLTKIFQVKMQI